MSIQSAGEFKGTERFRLIRRLGSGGMGVVYEAFDERRQSPVALKTLTHVTPEAIYQLKNEFRAIAGVTHQNLVALYELHADEGFWFITMELVRGRGFREYVSPGAGPGVSDLPTRTGVTPIGVTPSERLPGAPTSSNAADAAAVRAAATCDPARLRSALTQVVAGVRAIHAAGKLHRDLKPSNVLVTDEGRVVILDFGIASDLPGRVENLGLTSIPYAGTPIYMAPEQYAGTDLTEAADWYAVGVMLFEALAGRPPFTAPTIGGLAHEKLTSDGGRPSAVCEGVPADLDGLCADLLRRDPRDRPLGTEVARLLEASASVVIRTREPDPLSVSRGAPVLVGRDDTLAELRDARGRVGLEGPIAIFLQGRSGMGKSAVLQAFLDECAADSETVVLAGRCYESESVPFKALDALMDSLARYLRRLPPEEIAELLPRRADVLARMFTALARVPAFAEAPRARVAGKDAVEERQVASIALRELAGRLTDRSPVIVAIDDLQWGDLDSAVLIGELLAAPDPPPLLLVFAARSEQASACLAYLRDPARTFTRLDVTLQPLTGADVARLQARLDPEAEPLAPERLARLVADAGGNPFIIREALEAGADADAGHEAVAGMIREKVARLDAGSRRLVEIVSLSARPLELSRACEAAGIVGDSQRIVTSLRNARLLKRAGADDRETLETYHDRIRETVVLQLDGEHLAASHACLAAALGRGGRADPEHLAFHLEGAGRIGEAAGLYDSAAGQASQALAFDHAVMLYERALRLKGGQADGSFLRRLAEALADAGRSRDAGARFAEAARLATAAERRELIRRSAYYFCISGRIAEGKAALGEVLNQFGISLPKSTGAAIASVLFARLRLRLRGLGFKPRPPEALTADTRERLDSLWAAAIGLGNTEVISGIGFSSRGLLQALQAGDPVRAVRAMCWEACLLAVDDVRGARRLIDRAEVIVRTCETPYLRGMLLLAEAIYTINLTRWRDAVALFDRAEALWVEHCHGVDWELNTARHFCSWSLFYSGELAEMRRRLAVYRREAADRGNLYVTVSMGAFAEPLGHFAAGDPAGARARREEVMALWSGQQFNVQHVIAMISEIHSSLYAGAGAAALEATRRERAEAHRHGFDRLAVGRISTDYLTVNSALLAIAADGPSPVLLSEAARAIRNLEKETAPWGAAAAHAGRAGVAAVNGDRAAAVRCLEQAEASYTDLGMTGYALSARRYLGAMAGGERGREMIAGADTWLRAHGVEDPDNFCRLCVFVPPVAAGARQ